MISDLALQLNCARSIRRALGALDRVSTNALIIGPSTRSTIAFAQALSAARHCYVSAGPITSHPACKLQAHLMTPAEIVRSFAGASVLQRTVLSFPDQHASSGPACVQIPFLCSRYSFSTFESLLVMRHRPRVFALACRSSGGVFELREVEYEGLFDEDKLLSLPGLVQRLVAQLEIDLTHPPDDWVGQDTLSLKSQRAQCLQAREELKDVECLLRMHLQSRYCDRLRTSTALAAVVARQKLFTSVSSL